MIEVKKKYQKFIYNSIIGVKKIENQDNLLIIEEETYCLYAIFDGVGSAKNSRLATEIVIEFLKANYLKQVQYEVSIDKLMFECNNYLISQRVEETLTTFCAAYIPNDRSKHVVFSSMGDSRIYLITKQYIEQITKDDKYSFGRNVISKCLGMNLSKEDFTQNQIMLDSSSLLLCTDGFYNLFEESRLKYFESFQKHNLKSIMNELNSYLTGSNLDDATFIFIK